MAGVGSFTPAALTAATPKTWVPGRIVTVAKPFLQPTTSPSSVQTKVAGVTLETKPKVMPLARRIDPSDGPRVIVVSGATAGGLGGWVVPRANGASLTSKK